MSFSHFPPFSCAPVHLLTVVICVAFDLKTVKSVSRVVSSKRDFSEDCRAGSLQLETNAAFQAEENSRVCFAPEPVPKTTDEFIIHCNSSENWENKCKAAGGEVCNLKASVFGRYGGESTQDATYRWDVDTCVPVACKKGSNVPEATRYFTDVWCPLMQLTKCTMTLACGRSSGKSVIIVGATLGALSITALLSVLIFFLYQRYYRPYSTPVDTTTGAPSSAEYSELAQYEQDDAFISDHGAVEGEEQHALN